ncbi:aa3-type cytochrome c oxidase subunit IV [Oryzicola mucosus]|uniref:Aa3-type cytochrome c oxidase subunit IV n=1 Tax=Oryzicola mucosus TaxID=2767425 RepID=A0A8J6PIW7_9HYPH|nr:aa3-type cytochrome c oxidase subunit IV [Oryzicola mucosus]MBD0414366.1 aa3-type cytochrome c oxidase subunit IV [Oryzicola mucosus]
MADHTPAGPIEIGAKMDYPEHERTYAMFIHLAKYGTLVCVALLIAMAFGLLGGAGFIASTILFVLICAVGGFLFR